MANNKHAQLEADAYQNESILIIGMVRIREDYRLLIIEGSLSLFKGDIMLPGICLVLPIIPNELQLVHMYTVQTFVMTVKEFFVGSTNAIFCSFRTIPQKDQLGSTLPSHCAQRLTGYG